jgi:hypothetical protein
MCHLNSGLDKSLGLGLNFIARAFFDVISNPRARILIFSSCARAHGHRSFIKPEPMHNFTKALDKHIDNKRIPYNYRDNSKTTRIRTAIKEDPKKLATYIRGKR